jgi:hypothetical protein
VALNLTPAQKAKVDFAFRVLRNPSTSLKDKQGASATLVALNVNENVGIDNRQRAENVRTNTARIQRQQAEHDAHERALERALANSTRRS